MKTLWSWIRRDGMLHIVCSLLIVAVLGIIAPWWLAAIVGILVGFCKEIWDGFHGGASNWHDIICDLIGVALGIGVILIIHIA